MEKWRKDLCELKALLTRCLAEAKRGRLLPETQAFYELASHPALYRLALVAIEDAEKEVHEDEGS